MSYTIRPMKYEDIPAVQHVARTSWNATYDGIIPETVQDNFLKSAYSDDQMKLRIERSVIYVAETDDRVVGFANFSNVKPDAKVELAAIYLYPEQQGKGIGSALLEKGVTELEGAREIYISVEKENTIGANFYKAKGFTVTEEFDDNFDGHILKTVRMVLNV